MKVVQINAVCGVGSTGKICVAISEILSERGVENYILYSQGVSNYPLGIKYMSNHELKIQALFSRVFGNYGFNSRRATKRIIRHLERIQPDIVHLHNIHGHNCNLKMLFNYFKKEKIKLFWTFHDCWAFTGYCPHFDMIGCNKWLTECKKCPQHKKFSWFFDKSQQLYKLKKELVDDLDLTVIAPSKWMAELVKKSMFAQYSVHTIYGGIDLDVFKITPSDFRKKYGIFEDKKIVLGVAFGWGKAKGLDIFIDLAKRLDNQCYQVVLVGTDDEVDKTLPQNIISIHRTNSQQELAEIYTAADVFVNPTRQEVLGLVNLEALACGTPVVAFNTGGCPEAFDETCGILVSKDDVNVLESAIYQVCEQKLFFEENCVRFASHFRKKDMFVQQVDLLLEKETE